jgi:hypothetical protein
MGLKFALILFALLFAYLGIYLNVPLPEGIQEKWTLKAFLAGFKVAHLMVC